MSAYPLVSILVPIYNVERYLERCARSVLGQTYTNLEFVFVDDGSTDKSNYIIDKIIDEYLCHKERIILLRHQDNKGLASARNTAVDACHGDFVLHVDSDDWIEPNSVELLVKLQQETDADFVYSSRYYRHSNETKEAKEVNIRNWSTDKETLLTFFLQDQATISIWGKLIKKSLYTENGIKCDEHGSYYEDFQTLSRLLYFSNTIASLDVSIYHYNRCNPDSIVINIPNSIEIQRQGLNSIMAVYNFYLNKEHRYFSLVKRFYLCYMYRMLNINCKSGNKKGYYEYLGFLLKSEKESWHLIGWNKSCKRFVDKHYNLKRFFLVTRTIKLKAITLVKSVLSLWK